MYSILVNILNSISLISAVFISSTASSFYITNVLKKPFINPLFTKDKIQQNMSFIINNVLKVVSTTTLPIITIIDIYTLDNQNHTLIHTARNFFYSMLLIEFAYYTYHRIQHSFFLKIHRKHHENKNVYPFDTFYIDYYDSIGLSFCLLYPCFILTLNHIELFIILYFYATGAYLEHSDIFTTHHVIHHEKFNCNYSFIFPIFDILFQTNKEL